MELDENDLFEGGNAIGVEGKELIIPHETDVRPDEREGGREDKEQGNEKMGMDRYLRG